MPYAGLPADADVSAVRYVGLPADALSRTEQIAKGAPMTKTEAAAYARARAAFANDEGDRPKMLDDFISGTATLPTRIKETMQEYIPTRKTLATFARPILEGGGAGVGGALGTAGGAAAGLGIGSIPAGVTGGVLGTGLGYGIGKELADLIEGDSATKVALPITRDANGNMVLENPRYRDKTIGEMVGGTLSNVTTGMNMDMGGQLAGKYILSPLLTKFLKTRAEGFLPFTEKSSNAKAAEIWDGLQSEAPSRGGDTAALLERVGTKATPTAAQTSGNVRLAQFEQAAAAKDPVLMERLKYNDAHLASDAQQNMTKALGPVSAPMPITPSNGQAVGASIDNALKAAKAPIETAEDAMWAKVPSYPMPFTNFESTAKTLTNTPMMKSTKSVVDEVISYAGEMPKTVQGMQSLERTIGKQISKAVAANDGETVHYLGILKDSIGADFDAMGTAAENGDVALHNGNLVYPSKIQGEIDALQGRIATEQAAKQQATPDMAAIQQALRNAGHPPNLWMKQPNESPMQHNARLVDLYRKTVGENVPMVGTAEPGTVNRISQLQDILKNLQPADDAAKAYSAAKRFSAREKFGRFDVGAVKDVMARGDEATKLNLPLEAIPVKMFTPSGSADLVRALTPMQSGSMTAAQAAAAGQKAAGEQMLPHVMERLSANRIIDADGIIDAPRAMAFVRQNSETLNNLGLTDHMLRTFKEQVPASVKATLEKAADKGTDVLGNPTMTARQSAKLWRDYAPLWKAAGGDPTALQAMKDYHEIITILNRNKGVSYSGNSTSIEKLFGDAPAGSLGRKIFDKVSGALLGSGAGYAMGGTVGASAGGLAGMAGKAALDAAAAHSAQATRALLNDAITNPETAKMLMDLAKGLKVPQQQIDKRLTTLGVYAAYGAATSPSQ